VIHGLVQRLRLMSWAPALAVFVVAALVQSMWMEVEPDYRDQVSLQVWNHVLSNVWHYAASISVFFPFPIAIRAIPVGVVALIVSFGFICHLQTRVGVERGKNGPGGIRSILRALAVYDCFFLAYVASLLVINIKGGARYVMPVFPLLVYYALYAGVALTKRLRASWPRHRAAFLLTGMVCVYFWVAYVQWTRQTENSGIHMPESQSMFTFVREEFPADAIVAFRKPRVMALYGERTGTIWPEYSDVADTQRYFHDVGVTHYILGKPESGLKYPEWLRFDLHPAPPFFRLIFENAHFLVYEVEE
jgi:hypothetical protein